MSLVFDKHRLVSGLALPLAPLQHADAIASRHKVDTVLTVGLVNNMPDSALQATERQFKALLRTAAGSNIVDLRYFSLPSVKRSRAAQARIDRFYTNVADLNRLKFDGLIVTGAEPNAEFLNDEPYWKEFTELVEWAKTNTRSTIWSCLAAHAAVLHLDGIARHKLTAKCSGVFDCARVADDWLVENLTSPVKVSHSRLNEIKVEDLTARGYRVLTKSSVAGADIFTKQLRSYFVFFQGHPEYEALSLQREYRRDVARFLTGDRETYPCTPSNYFDVDTEERLTAFRERAFADRKPALIAELPRLTIRSDGASGRVAKAIFRNWLGYLSNRRLEAPAISS